MALRRDRFVTALEKFRMVGLDSALLIYHLENTAPYAALTEPLFAAVAAGAVRAVVSTVSVTEALVKPFADQDADRVDEFSWFVHSLPNTLLAAPDFETAKDAARLRARYGLLTPDALLLATTRRHEGRAFITNDARLRKVSSEGLAVVVLDDYLR